MAIDSFLELLDGVKRTRPDNFVARCPAHDDRSPSLSIKDCSDGRVLVHCFAGCDVEDICSALGLTIADLMPERTLGRRKRGVRSTMPARDALGSLDHESIVVAAIANDIHEHQTVDTPTLIRLAQAVERIGRVRDSIAPARHKS